MNRYFTVGISTLCLALTSALYTAPTCSPRDITSEIPEITTPDSQNFEKIPNVAQYKNADWKNVVGIARGIPLNLAYQIANENENITFFFYTKGMYMVLETTEETFRGFGHGDAVFFTGHPWWGSAPGLADGYVKLKNNE